MRSADPVCCSIPQSLHHLENGIRDTLGWWELRGYGGREGVFPTEQGWFWKDLLIHGNYMQLPSERDGFIIF